MGPLLNSTVRMKSKAEIINMAASVRDRLKKRCLPGGQNLNDLLIRHAIERMLFRLSESIHGQSFVVKGAILFHLWQKIPHRITRDLDLLGLGRPTIGALIEVFRAICRHRVPSDGVVFDPDTVVAESIRSHAVRAGVRVRVQGRIGKARVPLQIDVGFGDAMAVIPEEVEFPSLLDLPRPKLRAYRMETVLAEKLEAVATLGLLNSRMKDLFDMWHLASGYSFRGQALADSIRATFRRRGSRVPVEMPPGLSETFWSDGNRQSLWKAFWRKSVKTDPALSLQQVVGLASSFLLPPAFAAAGNLKFQWLWRPGGPWLIEA